MAARARRRPGRSRSATFAAALASRLCGKSRSEAFVRAGGPDTIAVFAIRPARADIGGYGGSPPRGKTVRAGGPDIVAVFRDQAHRADIGEQGQELKDSAREPALRASQACFPVASDLGPVPTSSSPSMWLLRNTKWPYVRGCPCQRLTGNNKVHHKPQRVLKFPDSASGSRGCAPRGITARRR
jgi:hypothetical protein